METPITQTLYAKHPERWWYGKTVVARKEMRNALAIVAKGTKARITRKYNGFHIETFPCDCCGVSIRLTYVPLFDLALLEESMTDLQPNDTHIADYFCLCGHQFRDESPFPDAQKVERCMKCSVLTPRTGMKVKYNHAERSAMDAEYADRFLKRNEVYTVARYNQWAHHLTLSFVGYSNLLFNAALFSPVEDV